ncbi:MAG: methylated-DNA--[protein]-cysteine S-methyltransferase [Deltaproteobacteria bacterium]|nr:methylated-DNA--[protein]-cysteine S-methyltransferase [Deltaproteobacteria bacterium]
MAGTSAPEIYFWRIKLDRLYVHMASTKKGALRIGMGLDASVNTKAFFKKRYPDFELLESHEVNDPLQETIEAAFWGQPLQEALKMDVACTPFQWAAMKAIADIPFGETRTYKEVADMAGSPKGARAVGQAMGRNPLPLIFP